MTIHGSGSTLAEAMLSAIRGWWAGALESAAGDRLSEHYAVCYRIVGVRGLLEARRRGRWPEEGEWRDGGRSPVRTLAMPRSMT
jgi:hypothetical protein